MSGRAEYERYAAEAAEGAVAGQGLAPEDAERPAAPEGADGPGDGVASGGADASDPASAPADEAAPNDEPAGTGSAGDAAHGGDAAEEASEGAPGAGDTGLAAALAQAERQRDEYLDHLRRERAEFENFRKRATRERMEALDRGAEGLITDLLGVLDDFDRVLEAAERSEDTQLAKGVAMVHSGLRGVLAEAGLEPVPGAGAPFDPNWHEAMMQVEADEPVEQPTVFEVLRPGYRYKGRVLRPASVSVAQ